MRNRRERREKKNKENLLVSVGTDASRLIVLGAIIVGAVVEGAVPLSHRSAPPLVHEMPVEARERSVLRAFALYEEGTLVDAELLQVSGMRIHCARHYFSPVGCRALPPRCLAAASLSLFLSLSLSLVTVAHTCIFADRRTRASRIGRVRCSRLSRSSLSVSLTRSLTLSPSHSHVRTVPLSLYLSRSRSLSSSPSHSAPSSRTVTFYF